MWGNMNFRWASESCHGLTKVMRQRDRKYLDEFTFSKLYSEANIVCLGVIA